MQETQVKENSENLEIKIPEGLDLVQIRKDFPILDSEIDGKKLIYLDNGATTHKPIQTLERMKEFMLKENGTVRRGLYSLSANSTKLFDEARHTVKEFINAGSDNEIIFTRGTTESINLVAQSFSEAFINEGDAILISAIEHHANIVPWQIQAEKIKAKLLVIPVLDSGELDLEEFHKLIKTPNLKILAVNHVANSLGTVNPVKEMIQAAHAEGVKVLLDGAQSAPHMKVDIQDLDADFFTFSGHKVFGPTGIGVLYGKAELLKAMPPYQSGGEMIEKVTFEKTTYAEAPHKFEPGTPAIAEAIGLAESIRYIEKIGLDKIETYEQELLKYATAKISEIPNIKIIGEAKNKASLVSFTSDIAEAFDIGTLINEYGVAIRVGHHCAQPVMQRFNVSSTARASFAFYNTKEDIDAFIEALKKVLEMLG
ncbi:MAG: cysteine desulfurase [Candidatus Caenarcaniphilales bacterium]|nr:cysteine desulfurase [Candidatus Caenarcaniphilales bacterium]